MRKKDKKTKRDFSSIPVSVPIGTNETKLDSFEDFAVGDDAWYRVSPSLPSYSCGKIKEIRSESDCVTFFIWDLERGIWRYLRRDDIYKRKPPRKKRGE